MIRLISILLLLLACSIPSVAKEGEEAPKPNIILIKKPKNPRPGAPSQSFITARYEQGRIEFVVPESVLYITVYIGDEDNPVLVDSVTADAPFIEVEGLHGEYEITCRTDGNQVFGGFITLP